MNQRPVTVIGMVWYKPEDYDAVLGIVADRNNFSASFHEWRMKAETGEKQQRRDGHFVVRVFIDPKTFPDWCRARGLSIDAKARNQFAAEAAKNAYLGLQ